MQIDETAGTAEPVSVGARHSLPALASLGALAALFALGAWTWVLFARSAGSPTMLFTQTDFPAITIASRIAASGDGASLYDLNAQLEGQRRLISEGYVDLAPTDDLKYPYPYTPFIALALGLVSGGSPLGAMALWDLVNIGAMALGLLLLLSVLPLAPTVRWLVTAAGVGSFPFVVNLEQGQSSGVVALALCGGIALLKRSDRGARGDLVAGMGLGLLAVKVQWLPLIALVLLWKRRWWALAGVAAAAIALVAAATLALGPGWLGGYWATLLRSQAYDPALLLDPWYSHSLGGAVAALFGRGDEVTEFVRLANLALLVAAAGLLVYIWRGQWRPTSSRWDGAMAATLLAAMLTNPQLNTHDLSLLAIPAALGLSYLYASTDRTIPRTIWYACLWTLFATTALFLPQVFSLPVRITALGMVTMFCVVAWLLIFRPDGGSPESDIVI